MGKPNRAEIEAQIAALQAELASDDSGVDQDPVTGRWFVVLRSPGRRRTTTRRRAPEGRGRFTRLIADAALLAQRPANASTSTHSPTSAPPGDGDPRRLALAAPAAGDRPSHPQANRRHPSPRAAATG